MLAAAFSPLLWLAAPVATLVVAMFVVQELARILRQWRLLRHLPSPPAKHWVSGHVSVFLSTDAPLTLSEWAKAYGGAYRIRFFTAWGVVATDPTLVRAVLQNSKTYIPKDRRLYRALELVGGAPLPNILTSSDGPYWRLVRGAWMKCFTSPHLKRVLPTLQEICARVTEQIKQQAATPEATPAAAAAVAAPAGLHKSLAATQADAAAAAAAAGTLLNGAASNGSSSAAVSSSSKSSSGVPHGAALVNMVNITDRITLDVIGHVSYGRDFGAVDHRRSRYLELVSGMLAIMHEEMDHPWYKLLQRLRPDKGKALLRADWDAANTAEVMRAMADPPPEHTIAGQLLAVQDPATGKPLTPHQLKSEMAIATLAGFETTSNALSWTLGALACHPEAMAALEQELDVAGLLVTPANPSPSPFEWASLGRLPYLQAVIREGLRLFSPAANGSWRMCATTDIQVMDDLVIPKGTAVGVPWFAFGHNPAIYGPDAEDFRPERWLAAAAPGSTTHATNTNTSSSDARRKAGDAVDDGSASGSSSMDGASDAKASVTKCAAGGARAAGAAAAVGTAKPPNDPWTFSIGPRDCAGQALARLELQVVLASLVGHFRMWLAPEIGGWQQLLARRMYHTTLQIRGGLPMLLVPRDAGAGADGAGGAGSDCKVS